MAERISRVNGNLSIDSQLNAGIAVNLKISYRTARFHKTRIKEELGISRNAELVKYAVKHGLTSAS